MTGQQYRDWCLNKLSPMGRRHLAAFAASCTERQFGTYEFVARSDNRLDPVFVRGALDRAWGWIAGTDSLNHNFRELAERAAELAPDLETDPSPYAGFVSNVIISLYHTLLLCETGSAGDALAAGDAAINTVDEYVVTTTPHPTVLDREDLRALNKAVDESPLMRRELAKQEADLRYLEQQENIGVSQCDHLRRTWSNGSRSNIDLG